MEMDATKQANVKVYMQGLSTKLIVPFYLILKPICG